MQYLVAINQVRALEWGLNAQQAMLFAFLYQVPTWADSREIDGVTWFNVGKGKVTEELPLLTDKHDTVYRLMKQLRTAGLIGMTSCDNKTYIRLTEKVKSWNRVQRAEKNPSRGEKIDQGRKYLREGSEKSPTNQDTKIITPSHSDASESQPGMFEQTSLQADDGEPAADGLAQPRKQAMHLEWEPEPETYAVACWQRGLASDASVQDALLDFREYFATQPARTNTHADWTRRFVRWVYENQQRQQRAPISGGSHAPRRERTPKRRITAQEARAAAVGLSPAGSGETFDGQWTNANV